jgi:phospho-N-acetylmuramoyl-pentapeptide-transferase
MEATLFDAARVLVPFVTTFCVGIAVAPVLTHYLYKYKVWKKVVGKVALDGTTATEFEKLRTTGETRAGTETKTPRMGGILIWGSVLVMAIVTSVLALVSREYFSPIDFVDRSQTWLPLAALLFGGALGFINDYKDVTTPDARGVKVSIRLAAVALFGAFAGWWFYDKLDVSSVGLPLFGPLELGVFFIPFFICVALAVYASGVIDGIDGLSGGVFAIIFMAYAGIAFAQGQVTLAALSAAISGATFAFLWFNIPPARFWMTETGTMALTMALVVIAFSADVLGDGVGVGVLPVIAFPLVATVVGNVLQVASKKLFKRKLFRIAPIHHHFEAIGWPSYKVTMRYWVITLFAGIFGLALALLK